MTKERYFENCRTAEEVKKAYRDYAKKLHPDNPATGNAAAFREMKNEYESAWERLKNVHVNKDGEQYEKETDETAAEYMEMIERLFGIPGIQIELCGSWIWITGNTKAVKDDLKKLGFKFSSNKAAWYFHRDPYHKRGKKKCTMDDIRNMYGSKVYTGSRKKEEQEKITV